MGQAAQAGCFSFLLWYNPLVVFILSHEETIPISNSIAIARDLAASGFTREQSEAIAEVVVTHADESHATKADVAEVKASIHFLYWAVGACLFVSLATLTTAVNILLNLPSAG